MVLSVDMYVIFIIGASEGSVRDTCSPRGPNSFNFMQFCGKFAKIVCWHPLWRVGAPTRGNPRSATVYVVRYLQKTKKKYIRYKTLAIVL